MPPSFLSSVCQAEVRCLLSACWENTGLTSARLAQAAPESGRGSHLQLNPHNGEKGEQKSHPSGPEENDRALLPRATSLKEGGAAGSSRSNQSKAVVTGGNHNPEEGKHPPPSPQTGQGTPFPSGHTVTEHPLSHRHQVTNESVGTCLVWSPLELQTHSVRPILG